MLIVYPNQDWNTFVDIARSDILIGSFVSDNGYSALDDTANEAILIQTALQVRLCDKIVLPTAINNDLELAQCYLTTHALNIDMLSFDSNDKAISSERAGSVGVTYDTQYKTSNNGIFPPVVKSLLRPYGCVSSSNINTSTLSRS